MAADDLVLEFKVGSRLTARLLHEFYPDPHELIRVYHSKTSANRSFMSLKYHQIAWIRRKWEVA